MNEYLELISKKERLEWMLVPPRGFEGLAAVADSLWVWGVATEGLEAARDAARPLSPKHHRG